MIYQAVAFQNTSSARNRCPYLVSVPNFDKCWMTQEKLDSRLFHLPSNPRFLNVEILYLNPKMLVILMREGRRGGMIDWWEIISVLFCWQHAWQALQSSFSDFAVHEGLLYIRYGASIHTTSNGHVPMCRRSAWQSSRATGACIIATSYWGGDRVIHENKAFRSVSAIQRVVFQGVINVSSCEQLMHTQINHKWINWQTCLEKTLESTCQKRQVSRHVHKHQQAVAAD